MKIALIFLFIVGASPISAQEWWQGRWGVSDGACNVEFSDSGFVVTPEGIETENTYCAIDQIETFGPPETARLTLSCLHSGDTYPSERIFEKTDAGITVDYGTDETFPYMRCLE